MTDRIARLIGLLDDDSTETAEDAKAELMSIGVLALDSLVAAVGLLERFGQLSAIEVFEHFGDARVGLVLIELLSSEHETVREWSAQALAELRVRDAVPALRVAYERFKRSGQDSDVGEAVALRSALTEFGGRREVLPPLTASLRQQVGQLNRVWPSARLAEVIEDLAAHRPAVLYFQLWTVTDRGVYWRDHEALAWNHDRGAVWLDVVGAARENALIEIACAPVAENGFVTVEWIDEADR